jgi:hypothetical protein
MTNITHNISQMKGKQAANSVKLASEPTRSIWVVRGRQGLKEIASAVASPGTSSRVYQAHGNASPEMARNHMKMPPREPFRMPRSNCAN